ncbi:MAG: hypothetical protein C0501_20225 [Isosphaera sp.]|nr:hypothetical protein [Isosphaera sp.]
MRTLTRVTAAVLLTAVAAGAAPVPKEEPRPALEGKYALTAVSSAVNPADDPVKGPAAFPRVDRTTTYLPGPATITRDRIVLEGRVPATATAATLASVQLPVTLEYAVVDATKRPLHVDVFTVTPRGKKTKMEGLAEVVEDRLILAVAKAGGERPRTTDEADGVTVYYFRKAPPPPPAEFKIVALTVGKEAEAEKELNRLAKEGYELVSTTQPSAPDAKSSPTTVHFVLKRAAK